MRGWYFLRARLAGPGCHPMHGGEEVLSGHDGVSTLWLEERGATCAQMRGPVGSSLSRCNRSPASMPARFLEAEGSLPYRDLLAFSILLAMSPQSAFSKRIFGNKEKRGILVAGTSHVVVQYGQCTVTGAVPATHMAGASLF